MTTIVQGTKSHSQSKKYSLWFLLVSALVIAFTLATPHLVLWYRGALDTEAAGDSQGSFGDQFGAATALFSGLAFAGLIFALLMQQSDLQEQREILELQRKELVETRKVSQLQAEQLKSQAISMNRQIFENGFHQFLAIHRDVLGQVSVARPGVRLDPSYSSVSEASLFGADAVAVLVENLSQRVKPKPRHTFNYESDVSQLYSEWYRELDTQLGQYFRVLYNLCRYISDKAPSPEDKLLLGRMLRAQLSDAELVLLFYNCLGPFGERMQRYVIEFRLFDNLRPELLAEPHHRQFKPEWLRPEPSGT